MVARAQGEAARAKAWYAEALALSHAVGDRLQLARGLEGLAGIAIDEGHAAQAARLFGAAAHLRAAIGSAVLGVDQPANDRDLRAVRAALGEAAFATESAAGAALDVEHMVAAADMASP